MFIMGISKNKALKSIVNMDFNPNKTPIEVIKKVHLVVLFLETLKSDTKIHGKSLIS